MSSAYAFYLDGIEQSLSQTPYIAGSSLTLADISFVCDFAQFLREGHYKNQLAAADLTLISEHGQEQYPLAFDHLLELADQPALQRHLGTYLDWYRADKQTSASP